jgi:hypothetical protein
MSLKRHAASPPRGNVGPTVRYAHTHTCRGVRAEEARDPSSPESFVAAAPDLSHRLPSLSHHTALPTSATAAAAAAAAAAAHFTSRHHQ